jgi:Transposase, Mutator family
MLVSGMRTGGGRKELVALADGYRESAESWAGLLRDARRRGMCAPVLAVGDGALGFWAALAEAFPETGYQRDWVHKAMNVVDCLPKSAQAAARKALAQIRYAEDREHAEKAVKDFAAAYKAKYPKAVAKITGDQERLLAFFDFPADHWVHLKTSNPIESTFSTVRPRTRVTKGPGSRAAGLAAVLAVRARRSVTRRQIAAGEICGLDNLGYFRRAAIAGVAIIRWRGGTGACGNVWLWYRPGCPPVRGRVSRMARSEIPALEVTRANRMRGRPGLILAEGVAAADQRCRHTRGDDRPADAAQAAVRALGYACRGERLAVGSAQGQASHRDRLPCCWPASPFISSSTSCARCACALPLDFAKRSRYLRSSALSSGAVSRTNSCADLSPVTFATL